MTAAVALLCGCEALSRGESNTIRIADLEARVTALESERRQKDQDDGLRTIYMDGCLDKADRAYWKYVKLNGKRSTNRAHVGKEVWQAPPHIWEHAAQEKRNAIEECRVQFGKN